MARKDSLTAKNSRRSGGFGGWVGCMKMSEDYFVIMALMERAKAVGSSTGSPAMRRAC